MNPQEKQPEWPTGTDWEKGFDETLGKLFVATVLPPPEYPRLGELIEKTQELSNGFIKSFIRSFALTLLDEISRDMDMSLEYKEAIKQKYGL